MSYPPVPYPAVLSRIEVHPSLSLPCSSSPPALAAPPPSVSSSPPALSKHPSSSNVTLSLKQRRALLYPAPPSSRRLFQPFRSPIATDSTSSNSLQHGFDKGLAVKVSNYERKLEQLKLARRYQLADLLQDSGTSLRALENEANKWKQIGREAAAILFNHTCVGVETVEDAVKSKRTFDIAFGNRVIPTYKPRLSHQLLEGRRGHVGKQRAHHDDEEESSDEADKDLPDVRQIIEKARSKRSRGGMLEQETPTLVPRPMRVRDNKLETMSDCESDADDGASCRIAKEPANKWTVRKMLKAQQIPASLFYSDNSHDDSDE